MKNNQLSSFRQYYYSMVKEMTKPCVGNAYKAIQEDVAASDGINAVFYAVHPFSNENANRLTQGQGVNHFKQVGLQILYQFFLLIPKMVSKMSLTHIGKLSGNVYRFNHMTMNCSKTHIWSTSLVRTVPKLSFR